MRTRPLLTLKWSRKAMTLVIAAAPFQWTLAGNVSNAPASEFNAFVQQDGKTTLKGHVTDENGEPLIGATVNVKGTEERTVTDIDGNYTLRTSASHPTVIVSYLGYRNKELKASGSSILDIIMQPDQQSIDEVVVTALGIKREKKMLGYSVQDIKADALNTTGDPSVTGALDGKVAGLQIDRKSVV